VVCWSPFLKPVFGIDTTGIYVSRRFQQYHICVHWLSMGQMALDTSWLPDVAVCTARYRQIQVPETAQSPELRSED
jgi:hypothetical protein